MRVAARRIDLAQWRDMLVRPLRLRRHTVGRGRTVGQMAAHGFNRLAPEMMVFQLESEAYINDIPFNTNSISDEYLYNQSLNANYKLNDETTISDIPFNTQLIASQYNYDLATSMVFNHKEESYVDDIPFDTYALSLKTNCLNYSCSQ